MKPSKNEITGDPIITGTASDAYRNGWERTFGKNKSEQPKQKKVELPKLAFFLQIVEYESGWGSKPDGYLCFLTEEVAEAYRTNEYKDRTDVVPAYYVNYDSIGWKQVDEETATHLMNNDRGYLYMDHLPKKGK